MYLPTVSTVACNLASDKLSPNHILLYCYNCSHQQPSDKIKFTLQLINAAYKLKLYII